VKLLELEAGGREFAKCLRSLKQLGISNNERSEQFLKQNVFLTSFWRFFTSDPLEFKLQKIIGI
jgi:hypothetical protein